MKLRTTFWMTAAAVAAASTLAAQTPPPGIAAPKPATMQQQAPPELPPDTVVVTFDGKGYTVAQLKTMMAGLPPQALQGVMSNPQMAMNQLFLIRYLSDQAMTAKLDQQSPHKEALDAIRRQYLAQSQVQEENNRIVVAPTDMEGYYEKNKDKYEMAGLAVIYLSFSNNPVPPTDPKAKNPLTEAEAKAKAEKLAAELKAGADFGKLAKEHSDDRDSAEKGGDYATIRRADNFPAAIKDAVFKLEAGKISDPVRQANGFYILKRTSKTAQPYPEVRDQIFQQLKQEKFQQWFQELQKKMTVKIEKPEFFQK